MNNHYRVTWVIDIEAETPQAAAEQALAIQRNPESIATVFDIHTDMGEHLATVDLTPET